jgi:hypothetical protein
MSSSVWQYPWLCSPPKWLSVGPQWAGRKPTLGNTSELVKLLNPFRSKIPQVQNQVTYLHQIIITHNWILQRGDNLQISLNGQFTLVQHPLHVHIQRVYYLFYQQLPIHPVSAPHNTHMSLSKFLVLEVCPWWEAITEQLYWFLMSMGLWSQAEFQSLTWHKFT